MNSGNYWHQQERSRIQVSGPMSHTTEPSPPDDRRLDFQAVSDESTLTGKNESERAGAWKVDSVVTIKLLEHPTDRTG
ncbi:hypothetical protein BDQ94DRAFT_177454 [Aspergillus welwitschiae]|uniref:Uncharacterized protein n=1 Tax=Aspergillus welwitschiae TaxID=1341132 RepID=A0A3F3PHY6_9EURO|nr:hypothetical protein BDQ94DRAFT_177454 [Aspergillus welwitschiae]RDH26550.1 hypothetical protein BDQ94DRAFT_177454 [Aspergillus welwitschiae]